MLYSSGYSPGFALAHSLLEMADAKDPQLGAKEPQLGAGDPQLGAKPARTEAARRSYSLRTCCWTRKAAACISLQRARTATPRAVRCK